MRARMMGMAGVLVVAWVALAQAGPVQFKEVSADATWLAHVDVDAMRSSVVVEKLYNACVKGEKLAQCFDKMAEKCGMDPRKDLHDVTLYGRKMACGHGVLIIQADMDKEVLKQKAEKAPNHQTAKHRGHEIHTWTHKKGGEKKNIAAALHQSDVLVLASSVDLLETALDVLDGRKASLKPGKKPLAKKVPKGTMFLARATNIDESQMAKKNPLCAQLTCLDYAEGEHDKQWSGRLAISAENDEIADRLETALKGFRATCWLHLERAPQLQQILDEVKIDRDEDTVEVKFQAPVEKVASAMPEACEMIRKRMAKYHAKAKYHTKEKTCPTKIDKKRAEKKCPTKQEQKQKQDKQDKKAKSKASEKKNKEKPDRGMRKPTAQQGTAVLGVVVGKPLGEEAAEIVRVWEASPAVKAGLERGDQIVKIGKQEIRSPEQLRSTILRHQPGDEVTIVVKREGEPLELKTQ